MFAAAETPDAYNASDTAALHVLNRLGYGPRPGDVEAVKRMGIERYIESQLQPAAIPLPAALQDRLASLPVQQQSVGDTLAQYLSNRRASAKGDEDAKEKQRLTARNIVLQTSEARLLRAIESPRQLEEVMVDFWFNHFNVFIGKGLDNALVASYERDAIRPHVFGNFRDLLGATAKHPAMLFYLDNWLSTSPDFQPRREQGERGQGARARAKGLNENYARELMELHTLGVDGGYQQRDVTELARMLTGWSFTPQELARGGATFRFDARRHDNGMKQWLGQAIAPDGIGEGERALDVLAMHPATAHHLAFKLAQYFVQDNPPPALVERLAQRYLAVHGEIRPVLRTLFASPEFLSPSAVGAKFKTPMQFIVSAMRAGGLPADNLRPQLGMLRQLGMPLYGCQTPDGYKNTEAAWLNPDSLGRRISFANAIASGRNPRAARDGDMEPFPTTDDTPARRPADPNELLRTLGPSVSPATRQALAGQPMRLQAAMVLGSPDFMRH
ncbi:DUF1800 domain-containing protein [Noviherbaspirillum sp. 17J57-3]|uniref:DUF1800 domain-containing protein n=2 Tax=Noviherbaspirillum galbum TaxID=2709383 RepID=A0A6B3SRK6_9BURK|nr:DUF1800 domain-containing protein [Noviherbaspirillum galbum]